MSLTRMSVSCLSEEPAPTKSSTKRFAGFARMFSGVSYCAISRALAQDADPVAELDGLVDVVGDAHDGLAQLGLDRHQLVLQPLPGDRVDGAEGLVHEDDRRVGGQAAGDADALLLAAGELAGVAVAVLLRVEADEVEQLVDAGVDALAGPT